MIVEASPKLDSLASIALAGKRVNEAITLVASYFHPSAFECSHCDVTTTVGNSNHQAEFVPKSGI
jgi:hypothetical protein